MKWKITDADEYLIFDTTLTRPLYVYRIP